MMWSFLVTLAFLQASWAFRMKVSGQNFAGGDKVDVTSLIVGKEKDGMKCCCDAKSDLTQKSIQDTLFNQGRTGRCGMILTKNFKCATPVTQPAWAADRPLRHYVHSAKTCMVEPEDVKEIYTKYGSPPDYCAAINADGFEIVGAAAMNTDMPVRCPAGEYSTVQTTKCIYMSVSDGTFETKPVCEKAKEWCPPSAITEDEYWNYNPWVNGAPLNGIVDVWCAVGSSAAAEQVTCGKDRLFQPSPTCNKLKGFCSAVDSSDAKSGAIEEAAAYGERREVVCYAAGYVPYYQYVICSVNKDTVTAEYRAQDGQPLDAGLPCFKEQEYCYGIVPDQMEWLKGLAASVDPADIDQDVMVRCREGSEPNQFEVRCGSDRKYYPEPACTKIRDWCQTEQSEGEDGLFVFSASRDESQKVQCGTGWHPETATVFCGRNHQFTPKPTCVKSE